MQINIKNSLARKVKAVFLNGVDITRCCFYIDDAAGEAHCFKIDESGKFYLDSATNKASTEILHGKVEIIFKEEFK
jgi:hypothetical protein